MAKSGIIGRLGVAIAGIVVAASLTAGSTSESHHIYQVTSYDGTAIEVECAGKGPELLIVHGGAGDRTRWTPMMPYLQGDFTVCAMDRRAHGKSGDGTTYSLAAEAEDVIAVVASRKHPVAVLGHSFGAVVAYEAAFRSPSIARLILYEPPIIVGDHAATIAAVRSAIDSGDRDRATEIFMRDIVQVSPAGLARMRAQPSWPGLVATIDTSVRQDLALSTYRWDPEHAATLRRPVLLLRGGLTQSPELQNSILSLSKALPNTELVVLEGQEHNAMDGDREHLVSVIRAFLLTSS